MNYEETLKYIHSIKWQGSKPGLSRTQELLNALGNPEKSLKFVHVAGTNGKGSTSACIAAVLMHAGYCTGLYTSPFILRFNERIQVNGQQIQDEEIVRLIEEISAFAEQMEDHPTEFELITALGMKYFSEKKCDVVVLEVGMGGELDSTNVIDTPDVAVITAMGLDHMAQLGPTLTDIASAKAGIIKPCGDVVIYDDEPEADAVFEKRCFQKDAKLYKTDFSKIKVTSFDLDAVCFDFGKYKNIKLPLIGTYQPNNAATAITALEVLRDKGYAVKDDDIIFGLSEVVWPGRFEVLSKKPVFILDGSHNPHGMAATAKSLREHFGDKKITFLMGVMADKDVDQMVKLISPLALCFVAVRPNNPRAMSAEELAGRIQASNIPAQSCPDIQSGVFRALQIAGADGIVCALGSLYFSADVRAAVKTAPEHVHLV